ncbi:MAG: sensor histidine kinase, partial [Anaerolineaceae bacterium]|nr:sensor histidine kinase [Anaerolineaceae bacterium]
SLLRIQSRKTDEEKTQMMFQECQNRVMSLAFVHEKLYQTKQAQTVDLAEYIPTLVKHLYHSYVTDTMKIGLELDIDHVVLNVDHVIPIGLIVNELFSNSLKHAFPGERDEGGLIRVSLHRTNGEQINLCIEDNGIGFAGPAADNNSQSLGLQLVRMLTMGQLNGTIDFSSDTGSKYSITIKASMQSEN